MPTGPFAWNFPDAFVGRGTVSGDVPYPIISSTAYSSHAPASIEFVPWVQRAPIAVKNIVVLNSMNVVVPTATGQASTGSQGYSYGYTANLYSRQDYGANSTNLAPITTVSFGFSASLGYSSTSQSYVVTFNTDSTGGTSTYGASSADGGWSSSGSGPKYISIPLVTTLTIGEYWLGFQHSSTTLTSNSNVTLHSFSKLQQAWPVVPVGRLGSTVTQAFAGPVGLGFGVASAITTSTTMAASVISASVQPLIYFVLSGA